MGMSTHLSCISSSECSGRRWPTVLVRGACEVARFMILKAAVLRIADFEMRRVPLWPDAEICVWRFWKEQRSSVPCA